MNLLGSNCRGLGKPRTVRVLKDILKSHKTDLPFLYKTLVEGNKTEALSSKIGSGNFYSVDRLGSGGGLAVVWRQNMLCIVDNLSQNHVDINIKEGHGVS